MSEYGTWGVEDNPIVAQIKRCMDAFDRIESKVVHRPDDEAQTTVWHNITGRWYPFIISGLLCAIAIEAVAVAVMVR
ncbi:hypothetical protein ACFOY8_13490 [Thalassospira xianhensis]|uniref:Uncharacterized protein n=1 Tax=Thalassospira xianhensis MCCC 1A02616 TaxID=1177929 RepID=A0A367UIE6_9PROT|nr:hypothetical protein [Thalassospira xianhensis]RCK07800.1 hypothetical protein TH5_01795 [Thalassospira xianhensis MCCC 1A02616]